MSKPDLILLHAPSNLDFRERAILYGPISDVIPSAPVFEMYPIGFVSIAAHLERNGVPTRIVNIANRMLRERHFDVEKFIGKLSPLAFGIDLHWLPHAHGSLELARIIKRHSPSTPVILGGLSATYFHEELIQYPQVDFVVRGDSTELPMLQLLQRIKTRASVEDVPNLSWKDEDNVAHHNPLSFVPSDLDDIPLDYSYPIKSVVRYRDLASVLPFRNWLDYPITAALTCRGCSFRCITCGGSRYAYKNTCHRERPAYRNPQLVAKDIQSVQRYLRGPVFILGDIRQAGEDYAEQLLREISAKKITAPIVLELFSPAPEGFFRRVREAIPNFNIQFSPDSHDEKVRRAFGKGYSNLEMENTIQGALESGCKRFDLFFMVGLPLQTYQSVMDTGDYCRALLKEVNHKRRIHPMISPLAPFVDPGSQAFENPGAYGYRLLFHTFEEHRQALVNPSWKYMLNYETKWMSIAEIVDSTYDAALSFNQLKLEHGLITPEDAGATETRARQAMELIKVIDEIVTRYGVESARAEMAPLKSRVDGLNSSTICPKVELEWPASSFLHNVPRMVRAFCQNE